MKYRILIIILMMFFGGMNYAQTTSNLKAILDSVEKNNKSLIAAKKMAEAEYLGVTKDFNLSNPQIEYDYVGIGKSEWYSEMVISQSFDFPTTYIRKSEIRRTKQNLAWLNYEQKRLEMRIQAASLYLELVYLNRKNQLLIKQLQLFQKIDSIYKKKLINGQSTILEANKANMEYMMAKNEFLLNISELNAAIGNLSLLNNGINIWKNDSIYPEQSFNLNIDSLSKELENNDPELKKIKTYEQLSIQQLKLSKNYWLPSFELGFRSDKNPVTTSNGLHFGLNVPIFENRFAVKHAKADILSSQMAFEAYISEHRQRINQLYQKYKALSKNLLEMQTQYQYINTPEILQKSLEGGQISVMEFFTEYNTYNRFALVLEDLHKNTLTTLFELLNTKL